MTPDCLTTRKHANIVRSDFSGQSLVVSYLVVNPDGVFQEPVLLLLHPVRLKRLLTDFTQLQEERQLVRSFLSDLFVIVYVIYSVLKVYFKANIFYFS